ncbi:MAG: hypothetical protein ACXIUQ_10050 [Cecembia sp.]
MELKDYIKETITQITMGIKESQEELKDTGAVIVPKLTIARNERTIMSNDHTSSQQYFHMVTILKKRGYLLSEI